MNGLLQQAKRAARGFRTAADFIAIAYQRLGKLTHLPVSPSPPSCTLCHLPPALSSFGGDVNFHSKGNRALYVHNPLYLKRGWFSYPSQQIDETSPPKPK